MSPAYSTTSGCPSLALRAHKLLLLVLFAGVALPQPVAAQTGKMLPAETKVVVSLNLRQALADLKSVSFVKSYLDQFRLARQGDEQQLRKYYQARELKQYEGISEEQFLARCRTIKKAGEILGSIRSKILTGSLWGSNLPRPALSSSSRDASNRSGSRRQLNSLPGSISARSSNSPAQPCGKFPMLPAACTCRCSTPRPWPSRTAARP